MLSDMTLKTLGRQIELFERAAAYKAFPRLKVVALSEAEEMCFRLYPHHYRALQTIRISSQLGKPGVKVQDPFQKCESRLISLLVDVILDAVRFGDLELRKPQQPAEMAFSIWSLAFGTRALMDSRITTGQLGIEDGLAVNRDMTNLLLDALGWRPLSNEMDYEMLRRAVQRDLFADERREIEAQQTQAERERDMVMDQMDLQTKGK